MADETRDLDEELLNAVDDDGLDVDAALADDDKPAEPEKPPEPELEPEPAQPVVNVQAQAMEKRLEAERAENAAKAKAEEAKQAYEQSRQRLRDLEKKFVDGEDADPDERVAAIEAMQEARDALRDAEGSHAQARQYVEQANKPVNEVAINWVNANPRFNTDDAFFNETRRIEAEMNAEAAKRGMQWDWTNPATYKELDKRLKKPKAMNPRPSGPAPVSRGGDQESTQSNKPGKAEADLMRRFGLNPNDKRHLAEWRHQKTLLKEEAA
jgi:hypothetical protein